VGPDNNLYLSGVTTDEGAESVTWVVAKYSVTGSVVWQRLIENTASWTFTGGLFFENAGGSNIAVGPDYVALAGGFGTLGDDDPVATVVQIDTNGTLFSIGDWALTAASFTGNLDDTASDITVVNAGKTAGTATPTVADFVVEDDDSNFLIGTLYNAPGGNDSLVNGAYSVILGNTGTLTLPSGGTISEGIVTSNPTIQLTPANPDVASQKLVIKGGGGQYSITENGIEVYTNDNTYAVSDSANFGVVSLDNADQTLYWWIVPEGAGISTTMSGTVELDDSGFGVFNFTVISDAYEFRVRVSPEEDNYDPESIGVESVLINGDAPTFGSDYHLHLTTGDLTETSIFLGTDDHNVRTTVDGGVEINTRDYEDSASKTWRFSSSGEIYLPPSDPDNFFSGQIFSGGDNSGFLNLNIQGMASEEDYGGVRLGNGNNKPVELWAGLNTIFRFDSDGSLTLPGDIKSESAINIDINLSDSTLRRWTFGEDGNLNLPGSIQLSSGGIIAGTVGLDNGITIGASDTNSNTVMNGDVFLMDDAYFGKAIQEKFQELADATGTVNHDCSGGHIFYHASPDANWTVNLTNFTLTTNYATTITIIIDQGGTGYYPNALQISGSAQTINWQGNATPTPSTNRLDVVSFSILAVSGGYIVFGQLTGF
jgi:hypothetical protein